MAIECAHCGFRDPIPFKCKLCGGQYCYNHHLPEVHNCPGLVAYGDKIREGEKFEYGSQLPLKKRKRPLFGILEDGISIITNNYSLAILTIAIFTFSLDTIFNGLTKNLELYPSRIISQPWTLITFMFVYRGPWHLFFVVFNLFFIGPELERRIGGKMFLIVFFASGIIVAIGYSLWSVFAVGSDAPPASGASVAFYAVCACLVVIAPNISVYLYIIPMKILHALIFITLLDILINSLNYTIAYTIAIGIITGILFGLNIKETGQFNRY